jgi:predicted acyl esterase
MISSIIRIAFIFFLYLTICSWVPLQIPTRISVQDKKYLEADLYSMDTTVQKPVILIQTPYNKSKYRVWEQPGYAGASKIFDTISYNYVILDWRGFYANQSKDTTPYNRGLDGFDAVEWIAQQKWCNGKVGTWGGSALGEIQFQTARENPPHLVCSAPFIKDFKTKYEDFYYGGVYRREHVQSLVKLGFLTEDIILSHPTKDMLWNSVEKANDYANKFSIPMLIATGWFDHFPGDVIRAFEDIQTKSNSSVRNKHKLIVGPWTHSSFGLIKQGIMNFSEAAQYSDQLGKEFFDFYLLGKDNGYPERSAVNLFEIGSNRWETYPSWAAVPRVLDTLYLNLNGRLLEYPPPPKMGPMSDPPDTIRYNPRDPSPTLGGSRFNPFDNSVETGPQDISKLVESRNDIQIYTSEFSDEEYFINGAITAELFVGSDRKDTDFGVRISLVDKNKRSIILTQGIKRARFRENTSAEAFMEKDSVYKITVELSPISIKVEKGEQIRIDITSSNYPMFDINLNNGGELYKSGDTLVATNLIFRRPEYPSHVIIPTKKLFTGFDETSETSGVEVYPNPVQSIISISSKTSEVESYSIFNYLGVQIKTQNSSEELNVERLENGVYYLVLNLRNGVVLTKRIVVVK